MADSKASDNEDRLSTPRFQRVSILETFAFITLVALPLGCFRAYWDKVNNNVDGNTIAFVNASGSATASFFLGILLTVAVGAILVWRRRYLFALLYVVLIAAPCVIFGYPWLEANLIAPDRTPNPVAVQNCDTMTSVVRATNHFLKQSNGTWPRSWADLKETNPDLDLEKCVSRVDFDFDAKPKELAEMKWYEFTGISPHKPSYNYYSSELQVLINQLNGIDSTASQFEPYPKSPNVAPAKRRPNNS